MKKLSTLIVVMLLSVGMAFAQSNEAYVDQESYDQTTANDAFVDQTGNLNEARVTQVSTQFSVFGGHTARANQIGEDNYIRQIQVGGSNNFARADQDGNSNIAFQEQARNGNEARINQTGDSNEARQYQDMVTTIAASNNDALITQNGNGNFARQDQDLARNDAIINQNGDSNWARQSQDGVGSGIGHNLARTFQNGEGHYALTVQTGGASYPGPGHFARIDQTGFYNDATVRQRD